MKLKDVKAVHEVLEHTVPLSHVMFVYFFLSYVMV